MQAGYKNYATFGKYCCDSGTVQNRFIILFLLDVINNSYVPILFRTACFPMITSAFKCHFSNYRPARSVIYVNGNGNEKVRQEAKLSLG